MTLPSKRALLIGGAIVVVPVLAFAWWLLSPLFINKTVIEEFPFAANAEIPTGITKEEAEDVMAGMAKVNMSSVEAMPSEMAAATIISSGQFKDADAFHKGSGQATIYQLPDGESVLRFEGLNVTNGPDLHVIVTSHPDPKGRDEVHAAGYLDLGKLKGNRGDQNYPFPAGTDTTVFESVVIYCAPFHVVFSVATLQDQG